MKRSNAVEMENREIMRVARAERGMTQTELAERMGMLRNGLSMNLSRPRISLDMFTRILDAMGYDVVVVDREDGSEKWRVKVPE